MLLNHCSSAGHAVFFKLFVGKDCNTLPASIGVCCQFSSYLSLWERSDAVATGRGPSFGCCRSGLQHQEDPLPPLRRRPLPKGIGIYTNLRNRVSYSGSPLPQILASLSESVFGGEGLGVRGMHYVNIESNDSRAHTKESDDSNSKLLQRDPEQVFRIDSATNFGISQSM